MGKTIPHFATKKKKNLNLEESPKKTHTQRNVCSLTNAHIYIVTPGRRLGTTVRHFIIDG